MESIPASARGWITADIRYRRTVNGRYVQWGPAPSDPRTLDVDPVDVTPFLRKGENVIGVEVLAYGHGDGLNHLDLPINGTLAPIGVGICKIGRATQHGHHETRIVNCIA